MKKIAEAEVEEEGGAEEGAGAEDMVELLVLRSNARSPYILDLEKSWELIV